MKRLVWLIPLVLTGCVTNNNYGFNPGPGMSEDAQDRYNTKYNLMDSPDGMKDPNAKVKAWSTTY